MSLFEASSSDQYLLLTGHWMKMHEKSLWDHTHINGDDYDEIMAAV